ncbi:MAG: cytochrome c [Verrucomicrobia bacterium]|nr:cytochrome c [Verrucomicrobiota bacterium]
MRTFLAALALAVALVVGVLGFRGDLKRQPPLEIFPDMKRQMKLRPQATAAFFGDGRSSREFVPGTVARSTPLKVGDQLVYPFEDAPVNTGRLPGTTTNFIDAIPLPVTEEFMARGQQRFEINCLPCHGPLADGKGVTSKFGLAIVGNLHDKRIVTMPDGEIFNTITHGKNLMQGYGANVAVPDRWAVVAYLRALQRSRLGTLDEVPAEKRAGLK